MTASSVAASKLSVPCAALEEAMASGAGVAQRLRVMLRPQRYVGQQGCCDGSVIRGS